MNLSKLKKDIREQFLKIGCSGVIKEVFKFI